MSETPLDLAAIQEQLARSQGRDYWRSLEELAETKTFQEFLHREFPRQASEWAPSMNRRHFLRLMGASLALAGLSGCAGRPPEKIVPYVEAPEKTVPGKPLFFATAMQVGGYAIGLLAESHMNRPTKIEGNPDHPASLGATDAFAQASILTLYDPDRAKEISHDGSASDWQSFCLHCKLNWLHNKRAVGLGYEYSPKRSRLPPCSTSCRNFPVHFRMLCGINMSR